VRVEHRTEIGRAGARFVVAVFVVAVTHVLANERGSDAAAPVAQDEEDEGDDRQDDEDGPKHEG
jgi:hypothetical protein